jgi:hypothetical protein
VKRPFLTKKELYKYLNNFVKIGSCTALCSKRFKNCQHVLKFLS